MAKYKKLIKTLFSLGRFGGVRRDLSEILALAAMAGNPQNNFPSIHIAGTNGKGSVAHEVAEALRSSGYRVGLFTSPHLFTYRERIRVDEELISEKEVVEGLERLFKLIRRPKFFEVTTLLAFDYFSKRKVDIGVVEVGIGGRFDATNILSPILSVITTVDLDHTAILGKTLLEIAEEKAGIIKKGVPVVVGRGACFEPIFNKGERVYVAGESNTSIVRGVLKHIPFVLKEVHAAETRPPCRYERRGGIIFDVAHNPAAFTYLFRRVEHDFPDKKICVFLGFSKGKVVEESIKVIRHYADQIVLISAEHPRLTPPEGLKRYLPEAAIMNVEETCFRAIRAKEAGCLVVITGSFYVMTVLQHLYRSL